MSRMYKDFGTLPEHRIQELHLPQLPGHGCRLTAIRRRLSDGESDPTMRTAPPKLDWNVTSGRPNPINNNLCPPFFPRSGRGTADVGRCHPDLCLLYATTSGSGKNPSAPSSHAAVCFGIANKVSPRRHGRNPSSNNRSSAISVDAMAANQPH
ncbi:hypothetical protein ACLOJK_019463 [Asimina triloba]